jgi:DNA-binding response OmpR family regulator
MESFEFKVPIRVDDVLARRAARQTVLVVTPDDELREAARRVVMAAGFRAVTAAHSGHAVLACLTGPIDVVALDLAMDDTSGPALTERLRRHQPGLLSIYFAARGTAACEGVLVRPFTSDDLVERIEALFAAA